MEDFSTDDDDEKLVIKEEIDVKEEPMSQYDNNLSQVEFNFCFVNLLNKFIFRLPAVIITFLTLIGMNLVLNILQMKTINPIQNLKMTSSLLLRKRKMTVKKMFH